MSMAKDDSLLRALEEVLPLDRVFQIYHAATIPASCRSIYSAEPGAEPLNTTCESHILVISAFVDQEIEKEVLVFAIEVFVYTTKDLTTIFVSKADTTGFLKLLQLPAGSSSVSRQVSRTFISYLIDSKRDRRQLVVSLFARAQNQYLFPGSVDNGHKRVLDDRNLIKWWSQTLDPVLRKYIAESNGATFSPRSNENSATASAYLVVPGCETHETKSFFPASAKSDLPEQPRWQASHPLYRLSKNGTKTMPRCLVPRFPDDPKARFMDQLDEEIAGSSSNFGQWRSVKTLEQFWELMAYRQECSAGRLVGFLWVLINHHISEPKVQSASGEKRLPSVSFETPIELHSSSSARSQSRATDLTSDGSSSDKTALNERPNCLHSLTDLSNRETSESHDKARSPAIPEAIALQDVNGEADDKKESQSRENRLLQDQYHELLSRLLDLDFSSLVEATSSSSNFVAFGHKLVNNTDWGAKLVGRKAPSTGSAIAQTGVKPSGFNVLTSNVIKKKKRPLEDPAGSIASSAQETKVLSTNVVKKKPKQTVV